MLCSMSELIEAKLEVEAKSRSESLFRPPFPPPQLEVDKPAYSSESSMYITERIESLRARHRLFSVKGLPFRLVSKDRFPASRL